jgi:hypothetical protein
MLCSCSIVCTIPAAIVHIMAPVSDALSVEERWWHVARADVVWRR